MNDIKTLTIRLDDELHREFKIFTAQQGTDMSAILVDYIKNVLQKEKDANINQPE